MKKQSLQLLLILLVLFLGFSGYAKSSEAGINAIDTGDSIIFDLSKVVIKNGYIEISISVSSDNDISALDFSIQFNESKLKFDTLINHTSYVDDLSYYNPATKFLRFTSNSLVNYELKKPLLTLRFLSDSLSIGKHDFYSHKGYLNGDACSLVFLDSLDKPAIPKNVRPANSIKEHLACGSQHTVALRIDGQVWTWGNNTSGQLGDNSGNQSNVPVQVKGLSNTGFLTNAIAVAAGAEHSLAILCDGSIVAWGSNSSGQLGNGTNNPGLYPVLVKGLPAGVGAFSIAAGDLHSIAVLEDGTVWAWGENSDGQLGTNSTTGTLTAVQVHGVGDVDFLSNAFEVAAGAAHNLVLMKDGTVRAFGKSNRGQTGNGFMGGNELTPIKVQGVGQAGFLSNVISLDGGNSHSIAVLSDGSVKAWGDNRNGQLGDGTTMDKPVPIHVPGLSKVRSAAAGHEFSIVVLRDGTSRAWGNNSSGQLGNNTKGNSLSTPVIVHGIANVDSLTDAIAVAAGKEFSAVILDGGTSGVYCATGNNLSGQLGDNTLISKSFPVHIFGTLTAGLLVTSFTPVNGTAICSSGNITFTNTGSTGGTKTYFWNFGLGATPQTSTSSNPVSVKYTGTGVKTVSLIIADGPSCYGNRVDTVTQSINIISGADASFTSSPPVCEGQGINFYNAGSTGIGVTHNWNFGGGNLNSNDENPTGIIYATSGAYTVTHTVNVPTCAINDIKTITVTINPTPVVSFTSSGTACVSSTFNFFSKGTAGSGITYAWEFGAGASQVSSVVQNPGGVFYAMAGTKIINLTVKNQFGCANSITDSLDIKATPVAEFVSSTASSVCSGTPVDFLYTGDSANVSCLWSFGTGASPPTANTKNPTGILYPTAGFKNVQLTVTNDSTKCSVTLGKIFTIQSRPVADAGKDIVICGNKSKTIGITGIAGNKYNWFPESGLDNPASAEPLVSSVASANQYIVTVTNLSTQCFSTDTVLVKTSVRIRAGSDVAICRNTEVMIGDSLNIGQTYLWTPSKGLDNPAVASPVASPDSTTTYTLTVSGVGCAPVSDRVTVQVHQLPLAFAGHSKKLAKGETVQLQATGGESYVWSPATGLNNSSVANPIATPEINTRYQVLVTDIFGCEDTGSVTLIVNTPSYWTPSAFTPNGMGRNDVFFVRGDGIKDFECIVFDSSGEAVFSSRNINVGWDGKKQLTGEDMPEGAYVFFVKGTKTDGTLINDRGLVNLIR